MLSRALSLATVTLVIGCLTAVGVRAVENLEAGKTPAQIFSGTCSACHKSPRGLLRNVPASSLSGFLRQHYTTSSNMASLLSSYLVSNGAADTRFQAKQDKQGRDGAKEGAKQEAATRPAAQAEHDRNARQRLPRPGEIPDVMRPDHGPAQAAIDARQKQGKKGRPEEPPKAVEEPAKTEPPTEAPKADTAKGDDSAKLEGKPEPKGEAGKSEAGKSETAKVDAPRESVGEPPATRPDPVPPVTPAPAATAAAPSSTTASDAPPEAAAGSSVPPAQAAQPAPSAVAAAPALPPVPPAGPPAPPISQ